MKITVLLADDHTIVRQGLKVLLEATAEFTIVGEASTGWAAVAMTKKLLPDVVVMDYSMPEIDGLEATRQICRDVPSAKVLILSCYSDEEYVRQVVEAGAIGFLMKQTAGNDLLTAIREARRGNAFFSPVISRKLLELRHDGFLAGRRSDNTLRCLTSRENEVLKLIAEGRANKQIAGDLSISIKTVEKHRQQVMNKLHIHEIAGLTRYAIDKGIIQLLAFGQIGLRAGDLPTE